MTTCSIDGCARPKRCRGLCNAHYLRWRRHGDPLAGGPPMNEYESPAHRLRALTRRDESTGCLIWHGPTTNMGYGSISRNGESVGTHRFAWELAHGPIAEGLRVDHLCHNRACCELSHLRLATNAQNMANRLGASSNSKTGVRNVFPKGDKFIVKVRREGLTFHGGTFTNIQDAEAAAKALRRKVHGAFADSEVARSLISDPTARDAVRNIEREAVAA